MTTQIYSNPNLAKFSDAECKWLIFRVNVMGDRNALNLLNINAVNFSPASFGHSDGRRGVLVPPKTQIRRRRAH